MSRVYALGAIARMRPESAVERVLAYIKDNQASGMLVELLSKHADESDAIRVIPAIVPGSGQVSEPVASLVQERFGDAGRQAIDDARDRLEPAAEMWVHWKLAGIDLRSALGELAELGIIDDDPATVLSRVQAQRRNSGEKPIELSQPDALFAVLAESGRLVAFDAETGMLPCNHHRLLLDFAEATQGALRIDAPSEEWHRVSDEDYDAPYTVQFVCGEKLYRFGAENYGDWYDVEAVHNAVNYALQDRGRDERFIGLQSDGQVAYFFFASPNEFLPFAEKYRLPLSSDAAEAIKKGKAFEADVLTGLRDQE